VRARVTKGTPTLGPALASAGQAEGSGGRGTAGHRQPAAGAGAPAAPQLAVPGQCRTKDETTSVVVGDLQEHPVRVRG